MRDYPTVPNVFRVASSHSINNEGGAAGSYKTSVSAAAVATRATNVQHQQQQQQQMRLQQNGNFISDHHKQQQLQQQQQLHQQFQQQQNQKQSLGSSSTASATTATSPTENNSLPQNGKHQVKRLQQQQQHLQHKQTHQLTTSASIEHAPYAQRSESSPYATLPRSINGELMLKPHQLQQQQQPLTNHKSSIGDRIINTISGSIPSTGYDPATTRRSSSMASDLNAANSFTDLSNTEALAGQDELLLANYAGKDAEDFQRLHSSIPLAAANEGSFNFTYRRRPLPMAELPCGGRSRQPGNGYLWILTPVAASISVAIVIAALAGPQWLFTEEKLPNANYNGTANFNALDDGAFITKYTKSSLWILCSTLQGVESYNCIKIDYFPKEGYQPDPLDSTPAISYTVTKSCPFFLAAGIFLLISFIVFLIPTCSHQNNLFYFSAGIMFIVSGLLMLIGLIAYISILKAEIGSKLRPRSTLQPALLKVSYGQSFFLFVLGFIATEFVGLLNIFLYIGLQEVSYYSRLPCFSIANIHEKIREGENPRRRHRNTYKSFKLAETSSAAASSSAAAAANAAAFMDHKPLPKPRHQVHSVQMPEPQELEDYNRKLSSGPCRKHPEADSRRVYFEKLSASQCNVHSKSLAKSLHEFPDASPPPPPPSAISKNGRFGDLPQEFPLTRSVSTTTDIYTTGGGAASCTAATNTPHVERRSRRNMATNTRPSDTEMLSERKSEDGQRRRPASNTEADNVEASRLQEAYDEEPQSLCGLKRGIRKTKDELFQEFCKKAGVRPKPKNIYYITNEEDGGAEVSVQPTEATEGKQRRQANGVVDNEEALQALAREEERFYMQDGRNARRSSMYVEPTHLRKLNSNLSLHSLYPPTEKVYQKSLLDLERCDSSLDVWTPYPEAFYPHKGLPTFGGSHQRLQLLDQRNQPIYQSRTLPRSFVRRHVSESQDSIASNSMHASAGALHSLYGASQTRLSANHLMVHPQQHNAPQLQQLHPQQRILSLSRDNFNIQGMYQPPDPMRRNQLQPPQQLQAQQQQVQATQQPQQLQYAIVNLQPGPVQWPAAIPTSPANFPSKYQMYAPASNANVSNAVAPPVVAVSQNVNVAHFPHAILARSFSGASNTVSPVAATPAAPPKFQRAYAFDEQRRASAAHAEAMFDLDEIERERRRSHASLFTGGSSGGSVAAGSTEHYDLINGTAV